MDTRRSLQRPTTRKPQKRSVRSIGFLDALRDEIHRWSESPWDERTGPFWQNAETGANLLSTADVAWLRYATNDPNPIGTRQTRWIRYLQRSQDPASGIIQYGQGGQGHSSGHAMWTAVRVLHILGGELIYFPEYLRLLLSLAGLGTWFDSTDWDSPRSNHHEVLGLLPLMVSLNDNEREEMFYRKIAGQQDPEKGAFPTCRVNISRTFAYTTIFRPTGRIPPRPERIVDTILSLQRDSGFWEETPRFHAMDAAYILVRLPGVIGHREPDCYRALERLAAALLDFFTENRAIYLNNPHWMLALVHTFGLLQESFPECFPSEHPYRFHWDKPPMYRCRVIVEHVGRKATGR